MARALRRPTAQRPLISLVPMIDVMLILLVFFMVTSTYLNLDMIPIVERIEDAPDAASATGEGTTVLVRIGADGSTHLRGQPVDAATLASLMRARVADDPLTSVVLLPSTRATTQSLVSAMETLTGAGVTRLRLMRLESEP